MLSKSYNLNVINISKTTDKETQEFNKKAWRGGDIAHYGKPVQWKEKNFKFKAEENGKIVGTIFGKFESGVIYITTFIVDKDARRKGIGRILIDKVVESGKKFGAHKIWLITGADWEANKFYQKLGFKKIADFPNHHFHHDFVVYSKPL